MKKKTDFINTIKRLGTRGGIAIGCCFLGLLFFVLTISQTSFFPDYHNTAIFVHHQSKTGTSTGFAKSQIIPIQLLFESDYSHQAKEPLDENEFEEDFDEECALYTEQVAPVFPYGIFDTDSSHIAKRFSILNRATVPFFILYHSWKSFIS